MIIVKLNRSGAVPQYRQIVEQIAGMVENGTITPGSRLPSTRQFAESHGLNRSTVVNAYQELWSLGYVESTPGSRTKIRQRQPIADKDSRMKNGLIPWKTITAPQSERAFRYMTAQGRQMSMPSDPNVIDFARLYPDSRLYPMDSFRKAVNRVLLHKPPLVMAYGDPAGYGPLREYLAHRMQIHSVSIEPDEILITNGAQQGIELILKLLTRPGDDIVTESPTYSYIFPLLQYYQANSIGVPMLKDGMDLEALSRVLRKNKPAFLYTIPSLHNPTGITTSQAHRERLLSICEKHRLPIVEDGFEEEMKCAGKVVLPIKSMDRGQIVVYLGTFSKVLFPGLRIGWLAADRECVRRLIPIKRMCDLSTNTLAQASIYEFCRDGHYDRHVKRMQRIFQRRMQVALDAFDRYLPREHVSWRAPSGGYVIWLELKASRRSLAEHRNIMLKHGVSVSPGEIFFYNSAGPRFFRVSISTLNEDEIVLGAERLGSALSEIHGTR